MNKSQIDRIASVISKGTGFRTANYDSDTFFVLVGDTSTVHAFARMFDKIHVNGAPGHSFRLVIKTGYTGSEKPIMKSGFFDGDGACRVSYIAVCVDGPELLGDNVFSEVKTIESNTGSNRGNSILIVKGTEVGIEVLKDVFDDVMNVASTTGDIVKLFTDDNPELYCGSYSMMDEEEKDGFGFCFTTHQNFKDPVGFIRCNGYTLDFYRG